MATISERPSGAAIGFTLFAGVMMIMNGVFSALWGLSAILKDGFFVVAPNYLYDIDVSAWGWIHLILGAVVAMAGFSLASGAVWARSVGVILAALSAIAHFLVIPYYPVWSIIVIAIDVFVIWALTARAHDVATG
jgi:hypothetical protein